MELTNSQYWVDRYDRQGVLTVGTGITTEQQDIEYKIKEDFIFSYCPTDLYTLDYGCGIGRYARRFDKYFGYDPTPKAIDLAQRLNPGKVFSCHNFDIEFDLFFTSTVLQHCNDIIINTIFEKICRRNVTICLYENNTPGISDHVCGRSPVEYKNMIEKHTTIKTFDFHSHIVHGEKHSLTIIRI